VIVADSDVLIDFLRDRDPGASRLAEALAAGPVYTTAISVFELQSGARRKRERTLVRDLLGALEVLPFTAQAANLAAEARRELEKRGRKIGMADYLIAGCCLAHDARLLTRNRAHFERVPGLRLA